MRSRSATEVPPYFCTTSVTWGPVFRGRAAGCAAGEAASAVLTAGRGRGKVRSGRPEEHDRSDRPGRRDARLRRGRAVRRDGGGLVGRGRADGAAAPDEPGADRLRPRPGLPALRPRPEAPAAARRPLRPRRRLRRRHRDRAPGAAPGPPRPGRAGAPGGGVAPEPLARLGAAVTGIDPTPGSVEVARRHAEEGGLEIAYEESTLEAVADRGDRFDLVLALEVVEHTADVPAFLAALAEATRPGGLVVLATLSRTAASFLSAIVGAEYLLGWLPRGTHRWRSFLTPAELARHLRRVGLRPLDVSGVAYRADRGEFSLARDPSVNYLMSAGQG